VGDLKVPVDRVAEFRGGVRCRRAPQGPLGLTLTGRTARHPGEELELAFAGAAPAALPEQLEDVVIERAAAGEYRIVSGARVWSVAARSVHLHREIAERFYRAIPPRPAPWKRRLLFSVMLRIARSELGIALLRALRR
jgi:hypothetical protein